MLLKSPIAFQQYVRWVRELERFGHRGSATPHEHRAASYLVEELKKLGAQPEIEGFLGYRSSGMRLLIHVVCAAVGLGLLWVWPLAAVILGGVALISLFIEETSRGTLVSRLIPRAPSANVFARLPAQGTPRRRLLLLAHYDTQRTGAMWKDSFQRAACRDSQWIPAAFKGPMSLVSMAMLAEIGLGVLQAMGTMPIFVSVMAALVMCIFIAAAVVLLDWALGPYVPGAGDNGSGVAAVLSLGQKWLDEPVPDVEVILLFPGCEETGLTGAAAWADRHAAELVSLPTVFMNVDGVSFGPPKYLVCEVPVVGLHTLPYPASMIEACKQVAHSPDGVEALPQVMPGPTDGLALLVRGLPGITIIGSQDDCYLPNYHQLTDTSERMDFESAWAGTEFTWRLIVHWFEPHDQHAPTASAAANFNSPADAPLVVS
jgi:hypothetical protein